MPGVTGAAFVNTLPLSGAVAKRSLDIEGYTVPASKSAPLFWMNVITPDYFRRHGHPPRIGPRRSRRGPRWSARRHRDRVGGEAVLERTRIPSAGTCASSAKTTGTPSSASSADVRAFDPTRNVPDWIVGTLYVPHGPNATMEDGRIAADMTLTLRTSLSSEQTATMLRRAAADISGDVVVDDVKPMRAVFADAVAAPAATTSLLVTMAGLALVLGCTGVYGVLSFLVSRQTRDLGIRFALGAQRRDVFWLVIKEGAMLCAAGIAIGVAGALAVTRLLASELYGISPTDPATYAAVAFVVSLVTLTACYVPTRRAMGVDPLVVLRDQ